MKHLRILEAITQQLSPVDDRPVTRLTYGRHVTAVESRTMGLATWAWPQHPVPLDNLPDPESGLTAKTLAALVHDQSPVKASLGMAAVNSLLPEVPEKWVTDINAGDLIMKLGQGRRVAVIGHFPFVEAMRDAFTELMVFEKKPHPGDLSEALIPEKLPSADVVAITATTLANKTLGGILDCCSNTAVKLLVGPSTPLSTVLFDLGFNVIAGSIVTDREAVRSSIRKNVSFKHVKGVRHVVMDKAAIRQHP